MSSIDQSTIDKMRSFLGDKLNDVLRAYVATSEQNASKAKLAHQNKDIEALKMVAHALKGSSGTIGALRVMAAARQIELSCKDNQLASPEDLDALLHEIEAANQILRTMF